MYSIVLLSVILLCSVFKILFVSVSFLVMEFHLISSCLFCKNLKPLNFHFISLPKSLWSLTSRNSSIILKVSLRVNISTFSQ